SVVDMPVVMNASGSYADWLKSTRHDVTFGSRAVLCDVKNGGLRRDLSLAFEMDGTAESDNAPLFNQQDGEFVAGTDSLTAIQAAPGMPVLDRYLFRDFSAAGNAFSGAIAAPETAVRGPNWWLLRDYANLYKRIKTSGSHYALDARAYFPNRTSSNPKNNLFDIHAQKNNSGNGSIRVPVINREVGSQGAYAFRPVRASYAPVLLGVNAIYSLVYKGNRLQLVVDPFFIIWNPYDTQITADKFAVTLENGLAGGIQFKITDPSGVETIHGKPSSRWPTQGTDTSFADYAKHKSGVNANVSYLISDLTMNAGEVLFYSPPKEALRGSDANVLNDELVPGMNYDVLESGIFFDEFPDQTGGNWQPITRDQPGDYTIDVMFNILSQNNYAILNFIETNLPPSGRKPDELTTEANFGDHLSGKEFRLNWGGSQFKTNVDNGTRGYSLSYGFDELGTFKKSFGILSMLTIPTDYAEADTAMEVFSQLNVTAAVSTNSEIFARAPFNIVVKVISAYGYGNLMQEVGIDLDAIGASGNNGFYGKGYDLAEGDSSFPLLSIPQAPLYSLVQFSGANIGTRLFEPTHAIGNSWKPPYIPADSIYATRWVLQGPGNATLNDVSWQCNDALFDRYYLSGIAPAYTIGEGGYTMTAGSASVGIETTLQSFYGGSPELAKANPALEPYLPDGMTATQVEDLLTPADGYQKLGAYSLINGAFNVNSTSVAAWSALLSGNKDLAIQSLQGTTDSATGTPFPLSSSASDTTSTNGWEKLSRLTDEQIWDDQGTPNDTSDDTGLAAEIVNQVKARGPFMSLGDFVNRRISTDNSSAQGALQEAIEQAGINGNQSSGIRANTSYTIPNYSDYASIFPHAADPYIGDRNNATGIPLEINQANILLPIAPKLTARSDTFKIRAYGEVVSMRGDAVQAVCEATVQRVPDYVNTVDEPWDENYINPLFPSGATPQLDSMNQTFGRRFKIVSIRWLDHAEI
ncbi:MAG: hypothetical protein P8R37_06240, partial [Opitutae bacterium]|nr:hypothetical protein [Opitutae bacterium]